MPDSTFQLDVSASAIDSTLTDFPVPVTTLGLGGSVNAALFAADGGSGSDVWNSSDEAGTSQVGHKVAYWSDANSKQLTYAKIASISNLTGGTTYLQVGDSPGASDPFRSTDEMILPLIGDFNDVTSNGNDGTAVNGVTAGGQTGPDGSLDATGFNGTNQVVDIPAGTTILPSANDATVSLWFYDAATNASRETLLEIGGTSGIHVLIRNGTIYGCGLKSGTAYATSSSYAAGQWNHVALTLTDGGNAVLYLNGTAVDTQAFTTVTTYGADTGAIGGVSPNGGTSTNENGTSAAAGSQYFAGNISQVCVHDTALSAAEIKANYLLTGPNAATYLSAVEVSDEAGGELDPSVLKYGMILDDSTLKPGLVSDTYVSGTGTSDTLKPGVLDSEGNLKPGILDADGNIKPGALR